MFDAGMAIAVASSVITIGSLYQAGRAQIELVKAPKGEIGQILDRAFAPDDELPPDYSALLAQLD
jgi:hypothetical protein